MCVEKAAFTLRVAGVEDAGDIVDSEAVGGEYDGEECTAGAGQSRAAGAKLLLGSSECRMLQLVSEYKCVDSQDNRRSVAVLLPRGVTGDDGAISVDIVGGSTLRVGIDWPKEMTNARLLLRNMIHGIGVPKIDRSDPITGG